MYPVDRDRDIRELDVLVFGGIPEVPQPVFERDTYAYSELRRTRQLPHSSVAARVNATDSAIVLDLLHIDWASGEIQFEDVLPGGDEK
jgi:hypothetical protein